MQYTYDAWGKILSISGPMADTLGAVNPLTYRGYVYDAETDLYYLQSWYYDPAVGRFINADGLVSTGQGFVGNNMFAYCGNYPVNRVDYTGQIWSGIWEIVKATVTEIGKAMGLLSPAYAWCGAVASADGPLFLGDIVALAGGALLTLGAIGYGIYQVTQAPSIPLTKAEAKAEAITETLPSSTVIYRHGGTNPGNLTPSERDVA